MAPLKQIECTTCDGTGYYVSTFDLPKSQIDRDDIAIKGGIIDKDKYTKTGYRIDETETCNVCNGRRYITVLDHNNYHTIVDVLKLASNE